jgi:hypothetical protein
MESMDPLQSASEMVKRMRTNTILGPILFILPFSMAALVVVGFTDNDLVQMVFIIINALLVVVLVLSFLGILIFGDKKLLCSEEHVETMRALEILGSQKHEFQTIEVLPAENNPELPDPTASGIPNPKDIKKLEEKHD